MLEPKNECCHAFYPEEESISFVRITILLPKYDGLDQDNYVYGFRRELR